MIFRRTLQPGVLLVLLLAPWPAVAQKSAPWVGEDLRGAPCNGSSMEFGPYDYLQRNALPQKLRIVEKHHFTPVMEQLAAGDQTVPNIGYTLRAWPNHHRALYAMIRAWDIPTRDRDLGQGRGTPPECYLQRAVNFSPKDSSTRMLYGIFLQRHNRPAEALAQYREAETLDPANMQIKYNLGLLLAEEGQYTEARDYALTVYDAGFPLPGLRDKLKRAGYWNTGEQD